jgi:hypothetical protein
VGDGEDGAEAEGGVGGSESLRLGVIWEKNVDGDESKYQQSDES